MAGELYNHKWNNFIGGQSDDDYSISEGQFAYSENIDVKNTAYQVGLTQKASKLNFMNDENYGFIGLENSNGVKKLFYYGTGGNIYNTTSADFTPEANVGTTNTITNAIEFNDDVYFFTGLTTLTIYKSTKANLLAGTYGFSQVVPTGTAIPLGASYDGLVLLDVMYITVGNFLYSIDSTGIGEVIAEFPETIVGLTTISDLFKIYTVNGGYYYISPLDKQITYFKPLNIKIRDVLQKGGIDYIIAGESSSYSEFYYMNGQNLTSIKKSKKTNVDYPMGITGDKTERQKWNMLGSMIQVQDDLLYIDKGIYYSRIGHYGNKNDIFPRVFSNELSICSQGTNPAIIKNMYLFKEEIYYSYLDTTTGWGVDKFSLKNGINYTEKGFIFTEIFDAGTRSDRKTNKKFQIGYNSCSAGNELIVSYSIDKGAYTTLLTLNDSKNRAKVLIPHRFYSIQFRIELRGSAKLEEIILQGNIIDDV